MGKKKEELKEIGRKTKNPRNADGDEEERS